ncbi:MAG: AraC family transcriptional regulator [Myxococcales bacterium]|nr:AraC family transcriptional regulator [Myxococcales bacterium]MCB9749674.1 AraC family transcriptional regulator [Myxococcales bacterium]
MDFLSQLLEPIEIRGSVFCHGPVRAPWSFSGGAAGRCLFHCVVAGEAWVTPAAGDATRVAAGDVVLLPRGGRHRMGSGRRGAAVPLRDAIAREGEGPFARFQIGGEGPPARLICGSFELDGLDWHPLLRALPELLIVNVGVERWLAPTLTALERQLADLEPGAEFITRRLTEILFMQTLAAWLRAEELPRGWLRALRDARVGRALGLMHARPAEDWAVPRLAQAVGMSRSAFFTRFKQLVGQSPARYLQGWRMTLAARALRQGELSVAEVCARVGYVSVPSFSSAFRRHHGVTPAAYRRAGE